MTTDKLTNEQVLQLLEESTAGVRCNSAIVVDLCDELLRLRAQLAEYGGQRCTNVCQPFQPTHPSQVAHWCLLAQDHQGEHVHPCEVDRLRAGVARAKELRDGWAENYDIKVFAADEILKGFEP